MRLEQELVGLLEEELLRRLVAEAIGPAAIDRRDRAIGLDVLAERKPHHALAVELGIGSGRRGIGGFGVACFRRKARAQCNWEAQGKRAAYRISSRSSRHRSTELPIAAAEKRRFSQIGQLPNPLLEQILTDNLITARRMVSLPNFFWGVFQLIQKCQQRKFLGRWRLSL
jgi:hypothetical protein